MSEGAKSMKEEKKIAGTIAYAGKLSSLLGELNAKPENTRFLTNLVDRYYKEDNLKAAVDLCRRAYKKAPEHPEVLWDYASMLDESGRQREAINLYKKVQRRKAGTLARAAGRSEQWANSLINDCSLKIGFCYFDLQRSALAKKWLRRYLENIEKGVASDYDKNVAEAALETLENIKEIEQLIEREDWNKARYLIQRELKKEPEDFWLLTQLSFTYYEQRQYNKAFQAIKKAVALEPDEPLVMCHYAGALQMLGRATEAIVVYKKIIGKGAHKIGSVDTKEGIRWARSLINDCRYRIGLCYKDLGDRPLAVKWLKQHLANRRPGLPSIYSLTEVRKKLKQVAEGN